VQGQCLRFFARTRKTVEQHPVVDSRPVQPVPQRVQVSQGLYGLDMVRKGGEHGLIGFDRFFETVLLDVTLCSIELLDDILAHAGSDNFLNEVAAAHLRTGGVQVKKHYILSRLRTPNRSHSSAQTSNSVAPRHVAATALPLIWQL